MRIKKKVVEYSGTKAVILPKAWYIDLKRRYGKELTMIFMVVNEDEIRITPAWEDK